MQASLARMSFRADEMSKASRVDVGGIILENFVTCGLRFMSQGQEFGGWSAIVMPYYRRKVLGSQSPQINEI